MLQNARSVFFRFAGLSLCLVVFFLGQAQVEAASDKQVQAPVKNGTATSLEQYLYQNHYGAVRTYMAMAGHQSLEAKINNQDVTFILDTGANLTAITNSCAQRLKLPIHDLSTTITGIGGTMQGRPGRAPISSMTIQGWNLNRLSEVVVMPRGFPLPYDGLFGFDSLVLNKAIIFAGSGILMRPGPSARINIDRFMVARGYFPLPFRIVANRIVVDAKLNGHGFLAQVDCGASITSFDLGFVHQIGVPLKVVRGLYFVGVDNNRTQEFLFQPDKLQLGAATLKGKPPLFASPIAGASQFHIGALLGADFLRRFHGVVDMAAGRLWVKN